MRSLLLFAAFGQAIAAPPIRVLIITGQTDPAHNWRATTPILEKVLHDAGPFEVRVLEDPRTITAAMLAPRDALVLNYNGPRWGAEAEKAVEDFVSSGKGLVTFHGATYGPFMGTVQGPDRRFVHQPETAWAAYLDMLGVFWEPDKIGHSLRHTFTVRIVGREHPITRGMPAEFLANDELYHRMTLRPQARVLGVAFNDAAKRGTGQDEPIFWVTAYGKGRVFHATLGHDVVALEQPGVVALFVRATEWAGAGVVTLAPK